MLHAAWFVWHPLHGDGYQLWSGILGSFLTSVPGWLVAFWLFLRTHNCAAPWCLRLGKHPTADGHHRLCRRHHPDLPDRQLSLHEIHLRHHAAKKA